MVDKVILVNAASGEHRTYVGKAEHSLALKILEKGLRDAGFDNIDSFPKEDIYLDTRKFRTMGDGLKETANGAKDPLFALSTITDDYHIFETITKQIRKYVPNATIIAGGPHFQREKLVNSGGIRFRDSVEVALGKNLADAVVVGHGQPLIDLVIKYKGDIDLVDSNGFYRLNGSGVVGKGRGDYPKIEFIPATLSEHGSASLVLRDGCDNACDFCIAHRQRNDMPIGKAIRSLEAAITSTKDRQIVINDSNLPDPRNIDYYEEVFSCVDSRYRNFKSILLDPSLLLGDASELYEFFREHNITSFFFGREHPDARVAEMIGSRNNGKIKTQEQLDMEGERINEFIKYLDGLNHPTPNRVNGNKSFSVTIAYMATPFESEKSALRLLGEACNIVNLNTNNVDLFYILNFLKPYPGTRVKRKYLDYIKDPERFTDMSHITHAWSYDDVPEEYKKAVEVIDKTMAFFRTPWRNKLRLYLGRKTGNP